MLSWEASGGQPPSVAAFVASNQQQGVEVAQLPLEARRAKLPRASFCSNAASNQGSRSSWQIMRTSHTALRSWEFEIYRAVGEDRLPFEKGARKGLRTAAAGNAVPHFGYLELVPEPSSPAGRRS